MKTPVEMERRMNRVPDSLINNNSNDATYQASEPVS